MRDLDLYFRNVTCTQAETFSHPAIGMIRVEKQLTDGVPSAWSCQLAPVRMGHLFMIGADATMTPPRVAVGEPVGAGVSSAGPPVLTVMR